MCSLNCSPIELIMTSLVQHKKLKLKIQNNKIWWYGKNVSFDCFIYSCLVERNWKKKWKQSIWTSILIGAFLSFLYLNLVYKFKFEQTLVILYVILCTWVWTSFCSYSRFTLCNLKTETIPGRYYRHFVVNGLNWLFLLN